jgi:hypothetical protein
VLPKSTALVFSPSQTAVAGETHEMPIIHFARRVTHARRPVSSLCRSRQVSSVLSRSHWNAARPYLDEAQFVPAHRMAEELHRFGDVNQKQTRSKFSV